MDYSEYSELLAQLVMMSNSQGDDTAEWNATAPQQNVYQAPRMRPAVVPRFPAPNSTGAEQPWSPHANGAPLPQTAAGVQRRSAAPASATSPQQQSSKPTNEAASSVDELLKLVRSCGKQEPLPQRVLDEARLIDDRALALLIKQLDTAGLSHRGWSIFNHLRALMPAHPLDVFSFTAVIATCKTERGAERAVEVMDDMQARGIEQNVHTYTALMNVYGKCGKYTLALNIYQKMVEAGQVPNVVTYNTLIHTFGKLGQCDKALKVLDTMKKSGVQPVLRTYNTLIIACNLCNQPRKALTVSAWLLADGFLPSSTTYNALISAYGKVRQFDKALEIYQWMRHIDCSVITYSSLINVCEKAGYWEMALKIFNEMLENGCSPNSVTYNSLISACAQGGQYELAFQAFDRMGTHGCKPDVVTYTALINALERGGLWRKALEVFERMDRSGCQPDTIVYNAIIDSLWSTGLLWAQASAMQLLERARAQGHFACEPINTSAPQLELNLHGMTSGVAMASLHSWLQELSYIVRTLQRPLPASVVVTLAKAKGDPVNGLVKDAMSSMISFWDLPFRVSQNIRSGFALESTGALLTAWISRPGFGAFMSSLFPAGAAAGLEARLPEYEDQVLLACSAAFNQSRGSRSIFEAAGGAPMPPVYASQRPALVSDLLELGGQLSLPDDCVHDAVTLMDLACVKAGNAVPLMHVTALHMAAMRGAPATRLAVEEGLARISQVPAEVIDSMTWYIKGLLGEDADIRSPLSLLNIYLTSLGLCSVGQDAAFALAGCAMMLAASTVHSPALLEFAPSVVAAAVLYTERRMRGLLPFWPASLAKLTGLSDTADPKFVGAVALVQQLANNNLFADVFRIQNLTL